MKVIPKILAASVSIALVVASGFAAFAEERIDQTPAIGLKLLSVQKIWDAAPHNAFTDLVRFQNRWYCVFREADSHPVVPKGKLRIVTSGDGETWESAALLSHGNDDLRDAKLSVMPDGRLMLIGAVAYPQPKPPHPYQSLVWFSRDGKTWSKHVKIGGQNEWLWSIAWNDATAYSIAYCWHESPRIKTTVELRKSRDGRKWQTFVADMFPDGGKPNESSLVFAPDGTCYCLLRRDDGTTTGQLGVAQSPYKEWKWHDLGQRIGGPKMIRLADGRLLAAVRLMSDEPDPRGAYGKAARTSICWIDPKEGKMTEALKLPSGGDTSYAGMVVHDGILWVSYYSSHEGKTSIYLAKVAVD